MFRDPLHPIVCLLMALLAGAGAGPALAVADVTEVSVTVTIAKSSEAQDKITAEIRVKGTDLSNGTLTHPLAPQDPIELDLDGGDLALGVVFDDEAQLATLLPAGSYGLSVNGGNVTATLVYDPRPPVPSPAIDQPGAGNVLAPGPVEVQFTACPVCSQIGDSVAARLEEGTTELASETLTSADDTWTPSDGLGGDLLLGEASQFTATITHTAVRQKDVTPTGDDAFFVFTSRFIQSDAVTFETGFDAPTGDFCFVVNDPTPPPACAAVDDPWLGVFDPSGLVSTSVAGHAVDYDLTVGARGDITGTAMADLDDDTSKETQGTIRGKLGGKEGVARQKLSFALENEGLAARLRVGVSDELSIPGDSLSRVQRASGSIGATKIQEETLDDQSPLPVAAQGWRLDFTLGAGGALESGMLTLDGGRSFPLEGVNKFKIASDLSTLKLQSADKGIRLQLKQLALDDEAMAVTGGELGCKILGQSGRASLP